MKVVIHQPEFIPYIGFFERLADADIFVILDDVGYQKNGFINRNKIKTKNEAKWITIPVKGRSPNIKINEVVIDNSKDWSKSLLSLIEENYKNAPHFSEIFPIIKEALSKKWEKICDLDIYLLENINKILGFKVKIVKSSELGVNGRGNERLVKICQNLKANVYLSGPGTDKGHHVNEDEFESQGIKVQIMGFSNPQYLQQFSDKGFLPYMSIIDLLFNEGSNSVKIIKKEQK